MVHSTKHGRQIFFVTTRYQDKQNKLVNVEAKITTADTPTAFDK